MEGASAGNAKGRPLSRLSKASLATAGRRLQHLPVTSELAGLGRRAGRAVYQLPAPQSVRRVGARLRRRPGLRTVALRDLLLGDEGGLPAGDYAVATDDLLRPSTTIDRWPHVRLLEEYRKEGGEVLASERLSQTEYVRNARRCHEVTGRYFSATDESEILEVARGFLNWADGGPAPVRGAEGTPVGAPVRVRPIRQSDCFQVIDGHHRLAIAYANGAFQADVSVDWRAVWTPLQNLLREMSWLEGRFELYQPLDFPELRRNWTLVRRCDDRLAKMIAFLDARGLRTGSTKTYLDVASCYGWFLGAMQHAGFEVRGIERDPSGRTLAAQVFGLDPAGIGVGDCVPLLQADDRRYDVVSCFSLLHHFVLGRGSTSAEALARMLDECTGQVLFLDTGQGHEQWFRSTLVGWDEDHIEDWLRSNTTFREVVRLGRDEDGVGAYAGNYGRMLFACVR